MFDAYGQQFIVMPAAIFEQYKQLFLMWGIGVETNEKPSDRIYWTRSGPVNANGAPISHYTGVPGWESVHEQDALRQYAERVPAGGVIVEIGSEYGMSASLFATFAPRVPRPCDIYCIDLFPDEKLAAFTENMTEAGLLDRVHPIQADSGTYWYAWGVPIDLLFIDGDHSINGLKRDLNWLQYVKPGGFVLFHDVAQPENEQPAHALHVDVAHVLAAWMHGEYEHVDVEGWKFVEAVDRLRVYHRDELANGVINGVGNE